MKLLSGYLTLHCCLDGIYRSTGVDALGAMLGGMVICADGTTIDPAYEQDWEHAVEKAAEETAGDELAYRAACLFLREWLSVGFDPQIDQALRLLSGEKGRELWQDAAARVNTGQYRT